MRHLFIPLLFVIPLYYLTSCAQVTSSDGTKATVILADVSAKGFTVDTSNAVKMIGGVAKTGLITNGIVDTTGKVTSLLRSKDSTDADIALSNNKLSESIDTNQTNLNTVIDNNDTEVEIQTLLNNEKEIEIQTPLSENEEQPIEQ